MTITLMRGRAAGDTLSDLALGYGVTSRLVLAPVDEEVLAVLAAPGFHDGWPLRRCSETTRGLESIRRSLDERETRDALDTDHEQLFVHTPSCVPAPCESAYRPFEHLLLDLPAVDLCDEKVVFGLAPVPGGESRGDHIGSELRHAGRLCEAAREAAERGDDERVAEILDAHRTFLADHLLRWAPGCLRETESDARTHFYRGAAALALGVLAHAHETLR
jgi:putative dimethyl sulfoxide reductase chaperone